MVYQGPSRGCTSCKRRHRKSCLRCIRAGRVCGGYGPDLSFVVRHHQPKVPDASNPTISTARKCGLPRRIPITGTDTPPKDDIPPEISQAESNAFALRAFYYDYCLPTANCNLSRGYLAGLEGMVNQLGPESDLARACQAVAFGTHGKPLNRPQLVDKAGRFYEQLLGSLARALDHPQSVDIDQAKLVAMLLGIFQLNASSQDHLGDHVAHCRGLAALSGTGYLPLDLLEGSSVQNMSQTRKDGVLSVVALQGESESLNTLLFDLHSLWNKCRCLDPDDDPNLLWVEATSLNRRFEYWQGTRPSDFMPTKIGTIRPCPTSNPIAAGYWPGGVDTYFDLYVSAVWNIVRAARLLVVEITADLEQTQKTHFRDSRLSSTVRSVVDEMAASIPYHLAENLPSFLKNSVNEAEVDPNRALGGLLLMYPLYVASRTSLLTEELREYMKTCLTWIGENMGIGQAHVLAKHPDLDIDYLSSGIMIVWSGFLG